jgi:hypothetical protein
MTAICDDSDQRKAWVKYKFDWLLDFAGDHMCELAKDVAIALVLRYFNLET